MRSFSKTFNIPLSEKDIQNRQLMQTMQQMAQREEQFMREKLMREEEVQNRVKQLQKTYELETLRKQEKIKSKLQKSQKNRLQFLEKIVKRCKDNDKMFNEKIKTTTSKRKQSLRQAWKAATKFNQKILENRIIRHKSFDKGGQNHKEEDEQSLNKSLLIPDYVNQENKLPPPGSGFRSNSKPISSSFANRSLLKVQDQAIFQSNFLSEHKIQKLQKPICIEINIFERNCVTQENPQNPYQQKLRKTLIRHQQNLMDEQNKKIQEFGERLQKINLSRRKRDQIHKSKLKQSLVDSKGDYQDESHEQKEEKFNKKHTQRLKSQTQSNYRIKRASDWSELNRQRRQQFLQAQIQQGNDYLSQNKIRYLKEIMSKSITYNALQKKLYQGRLRHE